MLCFPGIYLYEFYVFNHAKHLLLLLLLLEKKAVLLGLFYISVIFHVKL